MTLTLIRIPTEEIIVIRPNMTTMPMRERRSSSSNSVTNNGAMTTTTKMNTKTSWINCLVFNEKWSLLNRNYRVMEILTSFIGSVHEEKKIFKENYLLCL